MTERDRLTYLTKNALAAYGSEAETHIKPQDFIADFLLASGVVVPPCPIGTKIYMLVTKRPKINFPEFTFIKDSKLTFLNIEKVIEQFGKTVFLSREEAKAKLKERSL